MKRPIDVITGAGSGAARTYDMLASFAGPDEQLNRLIEWKAGSPSSFRQYTIREILRGEDGTSTRGAHMQRQFTIELRVDFADADKLEPLKQTLQQAARHAFATAQLISDNPKSTKIVVFSDDFFSGHQEIALLDDVIQTGLTATGEETSGSDGISSELAAAVNGN